MRSRDFLVYSRKKILILIKLYSPSDFRFEKSVYRDVIVVTRDMLPTCASVCVVK